QVAMRWWVSRSGGVVQDANAPHLRDRQHVPRVTWPDSRDRVLAEPTAYLSESILLRGVEGGGDPGVDGGGNRQALGCVDRHLREQRRPLRPLAGLARGAHRLANDRFRPVHPPLILLGS